MPRRRKGDPLFRPVVVTLDDGTTVRCSISSVGREQTPRWVLMDQAGVQYIGPEAATSDKSPEAVQRLLSEWWSSREAPAS